MQKVDEDDVRNFISEWEKGDLDLFRHYLTMSVLDLVLSEHIPGSPIESIDFTTQCLMDRIKKYLSDHHLDYDRLSFKLEVDYEILNSKRPLDYLSISHYVMTREEDYPPDLASKRCELIRRSRDR